MAAQLTFAQAASLARGLGDFLDEVETQEADLSNLGALAPESLAEHWAEVKGFLEFMRDEWPKLLAAEGADRAGFATPRHWARWRASRESSPPAGPVIAAGTTGSIPATARLLGVIARLERGAVVLPGLDRELDEDSWNKLDPGHPQYGMKQLLARIGVAREDVEDWTPHTCKRAARNALRETLRPAPTTDAWREIADRGSGEIEEGLEGLSLVETAIREKKPPGCADIARSARNPGPHGRAGDAGSQSRAPRGGGMGRWNIAIDDSAGRPLANTPPGTFLALVAEAAIERFAPVPLLALLKHPLAAGGEATADFRRKVRELDRFCLRGPRPDPGLDGIERHRHRNTGSERKAARKYRRGARAVVREGRDDAQPRSPMFSKRTTSHCECRHPCMRQLPRRLPRRIWRAAPRDLWRGDAGTAAAALIASLEDESAGLAHHRTGSYPVLFRALAEERAVPPAYGLHPRLAILGTQEARLQSFDVLVLGGLNEGAWPRAAAADPWLSRPMRQKLGLEPPERAIGLSAHDFATLAAVRASFSPARSNRKGRLPRHRAGCSACCS
jgi:ATP-dependent helicase/nuclease subunit B